MDVNIITEGFPSDDGNEILLEEVSMKYIQPPDCTESRDGDFQELIITTRNNGVANFLNLKTNNWSFDSSDTLKAVIDDFCKRINYK